MWCSQPMWHLTLYVDVGAKNGTWERGKASFTNVNFWSLACVRQQSSVQVSCIPDSTNTHAWDMRKVNVISSSADMLIQTQWSLHYRTFFISELAEEPRYVSARYLSEIAINWGPAGLHSYLLKFCPFACTCKPLNGSWADLGQRIIEEFFQSTLWAHFWNGALP